MPDFRTRLRPESAPFRLGYADEVVALGSCFAEHIGERLRRHKVRTLLNPFGILYNPASVARGLDLLSGKAAFAPEELEEQQGLWHSYDFHGRFSHPQREQALQAMQAALAQGRRALRSATRLLITLGTAYVFEQRELGRVVANCHRMPAACFQRRRLSVDEARETLGRALQPLLEARADLRVILSVSPVRHLRDGHVANQRSKASLVLLADRLGHDFPQVHYYPAYELMLDDLRDYRFYAQDLVHPRTEAIDYIWAHFLDTYLPKADRPLLAEVERLLRAASHRPFHPESPRHQTFLRRQLAQLEKLAARHPALDWESERTRFIEQLAD